MTKVFWTAVALTAPMSATAVEPAARSCCAETRSSYPTFCAIPQIPTGVRDAGDFKVAVVDVRKAGRRVAEQSAPDTFGLVAGQSEPFGADARAQVAWPGSAQPTDTAAFAAAARRRATPPPRPRR
jgi:hypothetical protein